MMQCHKNGKRKTKRFPDVVLLPLNDKCNQGNIKAFFLSAGFFYRIF
jgi:hypothetical protein